MYDSFKRRIDYLRVSVTDRCNLRCIYCMPEEGVPEMSHYDILRFSEIVEVVRYGVENGITKVRITGGEPLVRKGIVDLISMISQISGITDLGMTTNAILLKKFAKDLKKAGLQRVNISLDTMNPKKYFEITRKGRLQDVIDGIFAAKEYGLEPIKINCVIKKSKDEPDAIDVAQFCHENELHIRYIREMDLEKGYFWQVQGGEGGKCSTCNRLRLTSNGKLKPCLFSNIEYDVRKLGVEQAYDLAVKNKPKSGSINQSNHFNNIGG